MAARAKIEPKVRGGKHNSQEPTLLTLRKEDQELFTWMENHPIDTKPSMPIQDAWYQNIKFSRDGQTDQRSRQERCISVRPLQKLDGHSLQGVVTPAAYVPPVEEETGRNEEKVLRLFPRAKVLTAWRLYSPILWIPLVRNAELDDIKYYLVSESGEIPDERKLSTLECGPPERCLTGSLPMEPAVKSRFFSPLLI